MRISVGVCRKNFASSFTAKQTRGRASTVPRVFGPLGEMGPMLFYAAQPFAPEMVELHCGLHVAEAILRDFARAPLGKELSDIVAANALALRRYNAKGFAIEIQVE